MANDREFDIIIFGASGFTGRLVAEYMHATHTPRGVKWAMAGRDLKKLAAVRDEMGLPASIPLVAADTSDAPSLKAMAARTKVICTTVGPYTYYGEPLVAACVEAGTDYVDLCGEVLWMRQMIEKYEARAKETGARIVFSCGFDSIPFDQGVAYIQEKFKEKFGHAASRVKGRVRAMKGTFSGGTAASLGATMEALKKNGGLISVLTSSFGLTPGFEGPEQPAFDKVFEDKGLGVWVTPFVMATINTKNVHRTNMLLGHPYGTDFEYDEMTIVGPGDKGREMAEQIASINPLGGSNAPKPGEGPSKEERETGFYDVLLVAEDNEGHVLKAAVKGDKDPGYGSTSKIISEAAIFLAEDHCKKAGGVYTAGAAFGTGIIPKLVERAGMTFDIEN